MNSLKLLKEKRGQLVKRSHEVLDLATRERRQLTGNEEMRLDQMKAEILNLDQSIAVQENEIRMASLCADGASGGYSIGDFRDMRRFSIAKAVRQLADGGSLDGVEAELHAEGRHLADNHGIPAKGNLILPIQVFSERRGMTATGETSVAGDQGGTLVPTETREAIPLLYSKSVLRALGARFLPDLIGNVSIPKLATGAIASHKAETVALDESSPTTSQILMSPNRLGTYVEISRQLLHQSENVADRLVRNDLLTTLALGIENGAINGTGDNNQPRGILNTVGIADIEGGDDGALPDWSHVLELEEAIASANADQSNQVGYLTNPKVRRVLKGTLKAATHHEFCWNGSTLNGYRAEVSTLVPSNGTKGGASGVCSSIIFGNWDDLLVGIWGGIDIMVNPFIKDIEGLVRIKGDVYYDTAIRRPQSFAAMQDALTTAPSED